MDNPLSEATRRELLDLARKSIRLHLEEGRLPSRGRDYGEIAPEPRGAFVTLKTAGGDLRGCIGQIFPRFPLDETVARMAVCAAQEDPRFRAVTADELPSLRIEISALTPPSPVTRPEEVVVGRHGLIITRGFRKGLLLPQVAPEWGWDREEFLEHTCLKAGLPRDAWKDPSTRIEWFEAEVWGEE